jgi:hypothetical protein
MSAEADLRLGAPDKWPLPPEFGNTFPLSVTPVLAGSLHVSAEEAARRLGNRAYTSLIAQVRDAVPNGAMLGDIDCENLSVRASQRLNKANRSAASFIEDVARQAFQDAHHEVETERADLMIQLRASIVPGSDAFSARFLTEPQQAKRSVIGVESAHAKAQSSPHALGSDIARAQPESNPPVQAAQSNSDQPDIARFLDRIDEAQSRHNARLEENDPDLLSPSFLRRHFGALLSPPTVDLQRPTDTARPLMLVGDADGSLLRLALAAWGAGYWHPSDNEQTLMLAVLLSEGVAMCKASAQSIADFQGDPIVGLQLKDIATALEASIAAQIEDNNAIPAQQLVFMGDILADRLTNQGGAIERAIRALHRRGAVFLRGNHDAVIDIPPGAATNANYYQWGGFARERLTDNATWQLLDDCFVNAWTDETHSIVLTHNGFFYDPRTDAWHTAVGRIPARDESGQVKSVQAFVEAMNDEALKAATVSTDFRPKAFIQGKDQLRPRNTLGPLPWVGHGHDGDCGLNDGRGVLNLNARADGDFIAVGVRVI